MKNETCLADFAGVVVKQLPKEPCRCHVDRVKEQHFIFSAENLPEPPPLLFTHDLVMTRTVHGYGNCVRVDVIHFYATGETHRQLAVLILAALFSGKEQRVVVDLRNEHSTIKFLEINFRGSHGVCWDHIRKPFQFTYHPEYPQRVPWGGHLVERDLPNFDLDFSEGSTFHPVNDLDKRDKAEIRGEDNSLMLVAELLLNIGLPACDVVAGSESVPPDKTYVLESFPGHRKVNPWSAEAQFHLPGSFSWPGEYPTLGK